MLFQGVQDCRGIPIFKSAVKGKVEYFFLRVFCIVRIVFSHFLNGTVSLGQLPFLLETQAPIFLCVRLDGRAYGGRNLGCETPEEKRAGKQGEDGDARD